MKKIIILALVVLIHSNIFAKTEDEIQTIYSEAIDARYQGDLARSRFLLESLVEEGITNEYLLVLLTEVYLDYMVQLAQQNDKQIIVSAYSGIRQNLAKIWEMQPTSENIQNNALRIVWGVGDQGLGILMTQMALENNKDHFFANYFAGVNFFNPTEYLKAEPFFRRIVDAPLKQGQEQFIFQSRVYLGDILFRKKSYNNSLKLYLDALELAESPDLIAKIAILYTYVQDFEPALDLFEQTPLFSMSDELFDAYLAGLFGLGTDQSLQYMNYLLTKNEDLPPFAQALVFYQLGRTQSALEVLEQDEFMKENLPWSYYDLQYKLYSRFEDTQNMDKARFQMGKVNFFLDKYPQSWEELFPLYQSKSLDDLSNRELTYYLGKIKLKQDQFQDALVYYEQLRDLNVTELLDIIDISLFLKEYDRAERVFAENINILDEIQQSFVNSYISASQKKFEEALEYIQRVLQYDVANIEILNFAATIYLELKNYSDAERLLDDSFEINPQNPETLNLLAYLYSLKRENLDIARRYIDQALADDPDNIAFLDTLAWVLVQRDELEEATPVFSKIEKHLETITDHSDYEDVYEHLIEFYTRMQNLDKVRQYQRLIE